MGDPETKVMDALVDFVLELDGASLPPAVAEAAGRSLMDWFGTAIRGAKEPLAGALGAVIGAAGGEPQATIVGRGVRTSALLAALANGAQSHALDFDDTHLPSIVHGSGPVAPVVLALGEWRHASGGDALAAFVAGFEVETRIGRVLGRTLADRGWLGFYASSCSQSLRRSCSCARSCGCRSSPVSRSRSCSTRTE
jgi:2-methylcitrate dehydratase PrpD